MWHSRFFTWMNLKKTSHQLALALNKQAHHEESYHLFVSLRVTHEYTVAVQEDTLYCFCVAIGMLWRSNTGLSLMCMFLFGFCLISPPKKNVRHLEFHTSWECRSQRIQDNRKLFHSTVSKAHSKLGVSTGLYNVDKTKPVAAYYPLTHSNKPPK